MPTCPIPSTTRIVMGGLLSLVKHPWFTVGVATASALATFTTGRKLLAHSTHSRWYVTYVGALCAAQLAAFGWKRSVVV